MPKQKRANEPEAAGLNPVDRLRLRVSAMINSPKAQAECRATIWPLDRDTDQAWLQVLEELGETDGLAMTTNSDGTVLLEWEAAVDGEEEVVADLAADLTVHRLHNEPAPF